MGILEIIGGFAIIVLSIIVIVAVTMQESKKDGLSALGGGDSGSFFDKNRGKTRDAMLARATSICGVAMVAAVLVVLASSLR